MSDARAADSSVPATGATTGPAAANRGPSAAAGNRAALLAAARRLFAEQGYAVPLSAIAKAAGVGQGSLYRHFPTRQALARGVVAETMEQLEARAAELASHDDGTAFDHLWRQIVDTLVESSGFLEAALGERHELAADLPSDALAHLLAAPLQQAREAGEVDGELTVEDVMLVLAMVHGATHRRPEVPDRRETAYRVLRLVGRGLQRD
ncbi:TetR/AcrR family transcriptional regulator [Ornithinimicrobium sp. Y1847]|uniref:TetR/AcrR family transcriptional regulator n=1 Tax=Ornithinimicrobium sp. Y1847 TaxID=3405419 RepID=UPI003B66C884